MTPELRLKDYEQRINEALAESFPQQGEASLLYEAMEYSLLAGGKRLRPMLLLESHRLCGGEEAQAMPFACALEMIHAYSLIHDDLPCMDDDDLRRGRPTNHKVFGEAMAVLAGDALQSAAFDRMLHAKGVPAERALEAAGILASAAGAAGMAGGQTLDIQGEGYSLSLSEVELLHRLKTGALISAAAEMGCVLAGGTAEQRAALKQYAGQLGLAFQIRDDMLDVEGESAQLGKNVGSDAAQEKNTFVRLLGLEECGRYLRKITDDAKSALDVFGADGAYLCWLADQLVTRMR